MKQWTKFKKYLDPNAHKRVIDVDSDGDSNDENSKRHSRTHMKKKVGDHL